MCFLYNILHLGFTGSRVDYSRAFFATWGHGPVQLSLVSWFSVLFCHLIQSRLALPVFRLEFRTLGDVPSFSPGQVNCIMGSCISFVQKSMLGQQPMMSLAFVFISDSRGKKMLVSDTVSRELYDNNASYTEIERKFIEFPVNLETPKKQYYPPL